VGRLFKLQSQEEIGRMREREGEIKREKGKRER